jgi:hypothetical protein
MEKSTHWRNFRWDGRDLKTGRCDDPQSVLYAIFCHHGEPVAQPRIGAATAMLSRQWTALSAYDPIAEVDALVRKLLRVFPQALENARPFPAVARLERFPIRLTIS